MNVIQGIYQSLLQDENFANGEINERGFSNPHPWSVRIIPKLFGWEQGLCYKSRSSRASTDADLL